VKTPDYSESDKTCQWQQLYHTKISHTKWDFPQQLIVLPGTFTALKKALWIRNCRETASTTLLFQLRHSKNLAATTSFKNPPINVYLLEEQSYQISSKSSLKWWSLRLFLKKVVTTTTTTITRWASIWDQFLIHKSGWQLFGKLWNKPRQNRNLLFESDNNISHNKCGVPLGSETRIFQLVFPSLKSGHSQNSRVSHLAIRLPTSMERYFRAQWNTAKVYIFSQ